MAVKPIEQAELDQFSIDQETNELYWRGRRVRTEMVLPNWLQPSAWAVAFAALVGAVDIIIKWVK